MHANFIKNKQQPKLIIILATVWAFSLFSCNSCNPEKQADLKAVREAEKIALKVKVRRFEQDLFKLDSVQPSYASLAAAYPEFWQIYVENIMELGPYQDTAALRGLNSFVRNGYIRDLYRQCQQQFPDFPVYENQLNDAARLYKYYFPGKATPEFVTFISAFNYAHPTVDSVIGIGLDFYLGENFEPYRASNINFPAYIIRKLRPEYLLPNTIKALGYSYYAPREGKRKFIEQIIQEGRLLYFMDKLLPEVHDSLKIGYTAAQLQWCHDNEAQMWAHFIDKKLLFSTDIVDYQRYLNEGPFTAAPDVPPESAPKIGIWAGWQIVRKYMKEHPEVSLQQLMEQNDFMKLFEQSKYKPK